MPPDRHRRRPPRPRHDAPRGRAAAVRARADARHARLAGRPSSARSRRWPREGLVDAAARAGDVRRRRRGARDGAARPRLAGGRARRPRAPTTAGSLELLALARPRARSRSARGYLDPRRCSRPAALGAALARAGAPPGRVGAACRSRASRRCARGSRARPAGASRAHDVVDLPRRAGRARRPPCAALARARRAGASSSRRPTSARSPRSARAGPARRCRCPSDARRRPARSCSPTRSQRTGARVVYLQPLFANPHGATLAPERRAQVLDAVRAAGAFLIEDDGPSATSRSAAEPPAPLFHDDPGRPRRARPLPDEVLGTGPAGSARRRRARPGRRAAARGADRRGPVRRRRRSSTRRSSSSSSPGWRRHLEGAARGAARAPRRAGRARSASTSGARRLGRVPTRRAAPVAAAARRHRRGGARSPRAARAGVMVSRRRAVASRPSRPARTCG